jgi:hypothetical protein
MATLFTRVMDNAGNGMVGVVVLVRRRWGISGRTDGVTADAGLYLVTDHNGFASGVVLGGEYRVWVGLNTDPRRIVVPDDDGTYLLQDLIGVTGGTANLTYRYQESSLQVLNGSTGAWHGFRVSGAEGEEVISIDEIGTATANYKWEAGTLFLRNADTNAWHAIYLTGAVPQFALGADGEMVTANARTTAGKLQIRNVTTGEYHTIYLTGSGSSWVIAAGEA